ncbi:MAG: DUF835 domain-containing protein [Thermoplasmata archaeon]|nr:DUF835 domain-containing protein [Thermoplasmata archaeon]
MRFALPRTTRGWFLVAAVLVFAASMPLLWANDEQAEFMANVVTPAISVLAAILSFSLYWTNRKTPFRRIGVFFVIAFAFLAAGWIAWPIYHQLMDDVPPVTLADAFWLAGYVIIASVLATTVLKTWTRIPNSVLAAELAFWIPMSVMLEFTVYTTAKSTDITAIEKVVYSMYPILDSIMLTLLIVLVWLYKRGRLEDYWLSISVSMLFLTVGDLLYAFTTASGEYSIGSLPDILYLCAYTVVAMGFAMIIRSRQRFSSITPEPERMLDDARPITLEAKKTYIVWGSDGKRAYEIMMEALDTGLEGLIIARKHPNTIREQYGLKKTATLWLSTTASQNVINPANFGILTDTIIRFIERGSNTIVLLDGFESLVTYNDFRKALLVIDHLKDVIIYRKSRLILVLDRITLTDKEAALVEKGTTVLT